MKYCLFSFMTVAFFSSLFCIVARPLRDFNILSLMFGKTKIHSEGEVDNTKI
jgi:hypothetical protein